MITMNQIESGPALNIYGTVRMVFGAALLVMGFLMTVAALLSSGTIGHMLIVVGVALACMAIGASMLVRQGWSRWGFYLLSGMTILGAAEAALRAHALARNVPWDRPLAAAIGLFFAWGLWTLSRPAAKAEWQRKD